MRKSTDDYGIGDAIRKVTSSLSIQPYAGCERRIKMLNEWGRRSFLGKALMSLILMKTSFLRGFTTPQEKDALDALELTRVLIVTEMKFFYFEYPDGQHHKYVGQAELLGIDEPGLGWFIQSDEVKTDTTAGGAAVRALTPGDRHGEVLAGWITEVYVEPQRYIIITSKKVDPANPAAARDVFITDELNGIYRARIFGPMQPSAANLQHGIDFPGAVSFDLYHE
jgi:hypothetical protein